ncbi:hypothetical protein M514_03481 [Trichuris suis]|uniref:Uncharacterized protein n=1 Tax=Trichuris suis TaxID=68888 RepID=A0A085NDN5_9BILA|nr:hypothetical protein M513_03481 [Trichuris suis]KFD67581.1 hypothetical protein M514_03481 [Trichuris suis]
MSSTILSSSRPQGSVKNLHGLHLHSDAPYGSTAAIRATPGPKEFNYTSSNEQVQASQPDFLHPFSMGTGQNLDCSESGGQKPFLTVSAHVTYALL